jgi:uncharacterized cupin superfamily protein
MVLSVVMKPTDMDPGVETELKAGDCASLEKGSSVNWNIIEMVMTFLTTN